GSHDGRHLRGGRRPERAGAAAFPGEDRAAAPARVRRGRGEPQLQQDGPEAVHHPARAQPPDPWPEAPNQLRPVPPLHPTREAHAGEALLAHARTLLAGMNDAVTAARSVGDELAGRMALLWKP